MILEDLRNELKKSIDEKIDAATIEQDNKKINISYVREKLKAAIEDKKTKRSDVSRSTGLGYITIINVLNENYEFEVKLSTLKKIEEYLNDLA